MIYLDMLKSSKELNAIFNKIVEKRYAKENMSAAGSEKNEQAMKLKNHLGFKRLSFFIPFITLIISYISFIVMANLRNIAEQDVFIIYPICSVLISLLVYVFLRIVYWVVDGFKKERID